MFAQPKGLEASSQLSKRGFVAGCFLAVFFALPDLARAADEGPEASAKPARPAPLPPLKPAERPVTRHVDIGAALALVQRVAEGQTGAGGVRYPSAIGVGLSARVDVARYLRGGLYVVRGSTTADLAPGALGLPGDPGAVPITSYSLGLRLSPMLPLNPRARVWATIGAGWGRLEVGRFDVSNGGTTYQVRERSFSFVEFPMGFGISIDVVKNWLAIEFEATGAFHAAERGTAVEKGQTIVGGRRVPVGPFPEIGATFVETIGLALIL
jgi:hypothetical protein